MEFSSLEKEYQVHVYETGPDGKLTLFSLFNFFQDIASDHAIKLGYGRDDLLKENNFWVLSRIYAKIASLPSWGENLRIKTWPRGTDRFFALRDFEVEFADGRSAARATSSWLIIDRESKRIRRPDDNLTSLNSACYNNVITRNAGKIESDCTNYSRTHELKVRVSDLDINLHTNNTRYLKWVTDSYELNFVLNNSPLSAEINYLAESRFNENISIMTAQEDKTGKLLIHSIVRITDNTELCRMRICWQNKRAK
jgi:acyl-ACP thioesterase